MAMKNRLKVNCSRCLCRTWSGHYTDYFFAKSEFAGDIATGRSPTARTTLSGFVAPGLLYFELFPFYTFISL